MLTCSGKKALTTLSSVWGLFTSLASDITVSFDNNKTYVSVCGRDGKQPQVLPMKYHGQFFCLHKMNLPL